MKDIAITKLTHPSNNYSLIATLDPIEEEEKNWMTPIIKYLNTGDILEDMVKARQLQMRAARYTLIENELYKRGFGTPLLKCITPDQGQVMLKEIHAGVYENYAEGQSLAHKATRQC